MFPKDFVWAEVEYAADVDYQEEAMSYGVNKNGKRGYALLTVKITEHEHKLQDKTRVKLNEARAYSIELDELKGIDAQLTRLSERKMDTMVNFRAQYNPGGTVGNLVEQDSPSPGFDEFISDFNAKVNEYFDNVSKIVDENGETKVMYHGSPVAGIREF